MRRRVTHPLAIEAEKKRELATLTSHVYRLESKALSLRRYIKENQDKLDSWNEEIVDAQMRIDALTKLVPKKNKRKKVVPIKEEPTTFAQRFEARHGLKLKGYRSKEK